MDPSQLGAGEPSRPEVPSRCARAQDAPRSRSLPASPQNRGQVKGHGRWVPLPLGQAVCSQASERPPRVLLDWRGGEGAGLEGRRGAGTVGKRGTLGTVVLAGEDDKAISPLSAGWRLQLPES